MGKASAAALEPYHWKAGDPSPNPAGRPKGSRSKLQEQVIKALYEDFSTHGPEAIERVRQRKPEVYLMACVSLLPKQAEKIQSPFVDVSDAELEALENHLAIVRAKMVQTIDATAEPRGRVADDVPSAQDSASVNGHSVSNGKDTDAQQVMDLTPDEGGLVAASHTVATPADQDDTA